MTVIVDNEAVTEVYVDPFIDPSNDAGPSKKSSLFDEEMTHFNITNKEGLLVGQTKVSSLDDLQRDMWVLVWYDAEVYIGQVMSIHPDHPQIGDGVRLRCLKNPYTVNPSVPQDFEPMINWITHPLKNIYVCPVRVRSAVRNRKDLWFYESR